MRGSEKWSGSGGLRGSGKWSGSGGLRGSGKWSKREKEGERKERDIRRVAVVLSNQWMLFFIQLFERC